MFAILLPRFSLSLFSFSRLSYFISVTSNIQLESLSFLLCVIFPPSNESTVIIPLFLESGFKSPFSAVSLLLLSHEL